MQGDQGQWEIDNDLAGALYAADPASFLAHGFSVALLGAVYLTRPGAGALAVLYVAFHGIANCLAIALWAWRRYKPLAFSARRWIDLHAMRNLALHSAPGLSIWLAFQNDSTDLATAHTVLLVALAALAYVANGLSLANLSGAVPTLLLPATVLHLLQPRHNGFALGVVLAVFIVGIYLFSAQYRGLFRGIVKARVAQERLAETVARQNVVIEEASLAKTRFFAAASQRSASAAACHRPAGTCADRPDHECAGAR